MIDQYTESVLIFLGINIVLALSLALPVSAGLLSLGQGGFMAIGAYVSALLTAWYGVPFPLALTAGRPRWPRWPASPSASPRCASRASTC